MSACYLNFESKMALQVGKEEIKPKPKPKPKIDTVWPLALTLVLWERRSTVALPLLAFTHHFHLCQEHQITEV